MTQLVFRQATPQDAPEIAQIYNHYIAHTVVTFEYDVLNVQEMTARMHQILNTGFFVLAECVQSGLLLGYAYAKPWSDRAGYRFTYESSIYLRHDRNKTATRGLGTKLYQHLLAQIEQSQRVKVLLGVIDSGNKASIALHQKLGFAKIATLPHVAIKFDRSLGIDYWAKYYIDAHH